MAFGQGLVVASDARRRFLGVGTVDPKRRQRIEELVEAVEGAPPDELDHLLTKACGQDSELRLEVELLLEAMTAAEDFFELPAVARMPLAADGALGRAEIGAVADGEPSGGRIRERFSFHGSSSRENRRLGPFELLYEIGRGGSGTVYEAVDTRVGTPVAVKVLDWASSAAIARFKQEFRALRGLTHPNLVRLHELQRIGPVWLLSMERVSGLSFREFLAGTDADGLRDAFAQLADGLTALHEARKLHCDVKPSNIRVTPEGRVVLLDFGLVKELEGTPRQMAGTPYYQAPEQWLGQPLHESSDWFSFGVMLFESLADHLPFVEGLCRTRDRPGEPVLSDRRSSGASRAHSRRYAELCRLCDRLLRPDPGGRAGRQEVRKALGLRSVRRPTSAPRGRRGNTDSRAELEQDWVIGRQGELRALQEAFRQSSEGRVVWARIAGASGMGKTSLAQRFAESLESHETGQDLLVLRARCFEREAVPYAVFDSLMDDLARWLEHQGPQERSRALPRDLWALVDLFPALGRFQGAIQVPDLDAQERKRRALSAFEDLFTALCAHRSVVLFFDDLQWGDFESLELWRKLIGRSDARLLIVSCHRSDEERSSAFVSGSIGLVSEAIQVELPLEPLDGPASRRLATEILSRRRAFSGRFVAEWAREIARESMGAPFLIHQLSMEAEASGPRSTGGRGVSGASVAGLLRNRTRGLSPGAVELLSVVAIAGQPLIMADAMQAAGLGAEARSCLTDLCAAGLIRLRRGESDELEVYHDCLRQAWLKELSDRQCRDLHRALGEALERSGRGEAEQLLRHFKAAGESGKELCYTVQSADQASRSLAFARAAELYRRALEVAPASATQTLRVSLAEALADAGRGRESAREYLIAMAGAEDEEATLDLQWRAAEQQLKGGFYDSGLKTMESVLARLSMRLPKSSSMVMARVVAGSLGLAFRGAAGGLVGSRRSPPERKVNKPSVALLRKIDVLRSLTMGLANVRPMAATDCAIRQLRLAREAGEPRRLGRALALAGGFFSTHSMGRGMARQMIAEARQVEASVDDPGLTGLVRIIQGLHAYLQGRGVEGLAFFEAAEEKLRTCAGVAWELDTTLFYELRLMLFLGRFHRLRERLPHVIEECRARNDLYAVSSMLADVAASMALIDDDPDRHDQLVSTVEASWSKTGFHLQHYLCLGARVEGAIYRGQGEKAWRCIEEGWKHIRGSALLRVDLVRLQAMNIRCRAALAAAAEAPPGSERRRRRMQRAGLGLGRIERIRHAWARPFALLGRAALHDLEGRPGQAVGILQGAIPLLEEQSLALHMRVGELRLAELQLAHSGERSSAGRAARGWMEDQGVGCPYRLLRLMAPGFVSAVGIGEV